MKVEVAPGTIVMFADIACPWAHAAAYGLHHAREQQGAAVEFDVRSFPLELFNERPTPKKTLDAEAEVLSGTIPDAGWNPWDAEPQTYPVTSLLAMEAVYAAKKQGLRVSDGLDRALRVAFFRDSRCVSLHSEILDVASGVEGLDMELLEAALIDGSARSKIFEDMEVARGDDVKGSPHVFLADGTNEHNPGFDMYWDKAAGRPVIRSFEPAVYDDLIRRAIAA